MVPGSKWIQDCQQTSTIIFLNIKYQSLFFDHLTSRKIRKNTCDGAPKEAPHGPRAWLLKPFLPIANQNLSQNCLVILGFKPTSNRSRQVHRRVLLQAHASHQIVLGFQRPHQSRGFFPNCHLMGGPVMLLDKVCGFTC